MRRALQLFAAAIVLGGAITWAATGANRAWTKTEVQIKTLDPVTGIEGISYQKKIPAGRGFSRRGVWRCIISGRRILHFS